MDKTLSKKERIWIKSMDICSKSGCHQMSNRSFLIGGLQFPLCARCTGLLLGQIIGIIMFFIGLKIKDCLIIILFIPMIIDGLVQMYTKYESTNIKRFITGGIFGIAFTYMIFNLVVAIFNKF